MRRLLLVLAGLFALPSVAAAQDFVELTDTQRGYNERGVAAIREGQYELAISSFESSLLIGEANVIYLNLGRAYQRAGQCMKARENYARVAGAPPVEAPTHDEVLGVLAKYSAELPEVCPAKITVKCDDPHTQVSLNDAAARACGAELVLEAPGNATHSVVARLGARSSSREVAVAEGEVVAIEVQFPAEEEPDEPPPPDEVVAKPVDPPSEVARRTPLQTVGLILGASGAAGITAGLILDATYVKGEVLNCSSHEDANPALCVRSNARTAKAVNTTVLSIGGGLLVGAVILYFVGGSAERGVGLHYDHGPVITYSTRF